MKRRTKHTNGTQLNETRNSTPARDAGIPAPRRCSALLVNDAKKDIAMIETRTTSHLRTASLVWIASVTYVYLESRFGPAYYISRASTTRRTARRIS